MYVPTKNPTLVHISAFPNFCFVYIKYSYASVVVYKYAHLNNQTCGQLCTPK